MALVGAFDYFGERWVVAPAGGGVILAFPKPDVWPDLPPVGAFEPIFEAAIWTLAVGAAAEILMHTLPGMHGGGLQGGASRPAYLSLIHI